MLLAMRMLLQNMGLYRLKDCEHLMECRDGLVRTRCPCDSVMPCRDGLIGKRVMAWRRIGITALA